MKKVIINSVIAEKETIVTLFYDGDENVVYYSMTRNGLPCYEFYQDLHIDVTEEQKAEILSHAAEIWGNTRGMYLLKNFVPLSADLWQFIEDCWDAIKRQEPKLFPKK